MWATGFRLLSARGYCTKGARRAAKSKEGRGEKRLLVAGVLRGRLLTEGKGSTC